MNCVRALSLHIRSSGLASRYCIASRLLTAYCLKASFYTVYILSLSFMNAILILLTCTIFVGSKLKYAGKFIGLSFDGRSSRWTHLSLHFLFRLRLWSFTLIVGRSTLSAAGLISSGLTGDPSRPQLCGCLHLLITSVFGGPSSPCFCDSIRNVEAHTRRLTPPRACPTTALP